MASYRKNPKLIKRFFSDSKAKERHVLVAHSQIRSCWDEKFDGDLDFPMDFFCLPGGKAPELIDIMKEVITSSKVPIKMTGLIFQNSITELTLNQVAHILEDFAQFLKDYPEHKVAFAQGLYPPRNKDFSAHITKVNCQLITFNDHYGHDAYHLTKVCVGKPRANQVFYTEKLDRWTDGYHLKDKRKIIKFIRNFHLFSFGEGNSKPYQNTWEMEDLKRVEVRTPCPGFDLREKIASKRMLKDGPDNPNVNTGTPRKLSKADTEDIDEIRQVRYVDDEELLEQVEVCTEKPEPVKEQDPNDKEQFEKKKNKDNKEQDLNDVEQFKKKRSKDKRTKKKGKQTRLSNWVKEGNKIGAFQSFQSMFEQMDKRLKNAEKREKRMRMKYKQQKKARESSSSESSGDSGSTSSTSSESEN